MRCATITTHVDDCDLDATRPLRMRVQVHQKPLSSKTNFIKKPISSKNHFSSKTTFIKNQFHQKTTFIKNHFHQKPISSKTNFIRALPVRGTHHPSKNNKVRVFLEGVAGRRPATPSHKHGLCPPLGSQLAFFLNIAGRRLAMFSKKARWGSKSGCLGFRV